MLMSSSAVFILEKSWKVEKILRFVQVWMKVAAIASSLTMLSFLRLDICHSLRSVALKGGLRRSGLRM